MTKPNDTLPTDLLGNPNRILSPKQAAEFVGLGLPTFRRLIWSKEIEVIRLSERRIGIRLGSLVDWLEKRAAA